MKNPTNNSTLPKTSRHLICGTFILEPGGFRRIQMSLSVFDIEEPPTSVEELGRNK